MVRPVNIFDMATKQADWLAERQNVVAGNVANANTPGYKAMDVKPFADVLSEKNSTSSLGMLITNSRHMNLDGSVQQIDRVMQNTDEITNSGNTVNMEQEVSRGAEIAQEMQFNVSVVKAFNQMYMKAIKG